MDYDIKRSKRKMESFSSTDKLLLRRWPYPRRCEDGDNLADTERRREAC